MTGTRPHILTDCIFSFPLHSQRLYISFILHSRANPFALQVILLTLTKQGVHPKVSTPPITGGCKHDWFREQSKG